MHTSEYVDYLKSDDWKERKKILLSMADNICSKCGANANILHHLNYHNLGCEVLGEDVVAVCSSCHNEIHGVKNEYKAYKGYC